MRQRGGFTLIEFLAMTIVIAILATLALFRFPSQDRFTVSGFADRFAQDLRLTQFLSMSQNARYRIVVTGTGYTIQTPAAVTYASPMPDITYPVTQSGVTLSPATTIIFDSLGHPYDGSNLALASNMVFTVTSGTSTNNVTVTQGTGLIQ